MQASKLDRLKNQAPTASLFALSGPSQKRGMTQTPALGMNGQSATAKNQFKPG